MVGKLNFKGGVFMEDQFEFVTPIAESSANTGNLTAIYTDAHGNEVEI